MGIKERKEREKTKRRNDLIDAAERIFFTKGFDNATMDAVAEEAEFSKATLYLYFKNKEDLYLAIIERGSMILKKMFANVSKRRASGFEKIRAIGQAYCKFAKKYPDYFNAMLYFESAEFGRLLVASPFAQACYEQSHQILDVVIEVLQQGVADGTVRADIDPNLVATILWAQSTGVLQIAHNRGDHLKSYHNVDPKKMIDEMIEFMGRSLKA